MRDNYLIALSQILFITLLSTSDAYSEYIVQLDVQQAGVVENIYIKLLENDAPLTVQNFRNYVSDKDYDNSFIHRSISGFIVQGGGFTFDPTLNEGAFTFSTGGLLEVPVDSQIVNEFGNSNLRGTIAMAKLGGNPDSATSQWFFNLSNNSANLDNQNGGFTVFAKVLGNGMNVIDGIASQPVYNRTDVRSAFSSIPLLNFTSDPVTADNLVLIKSITELLSITPDINYGLVTPSTNLQPEVIIVNTGVDSVSIGSIGGQNSLLPPFSIVSDLCSNRVLLPGQRCSLIALFSPETSGSFEDNFDIELSGLGINYQINLTGEGGLDAPETDIASSVSSVNFGSLDIFYSQDAAPYTRQVFINNFGDLQLDFSNISLSASSDSSFSLSGNCLDVTSLASGEVCAINISYLPLVGGSMSASIIIESNDPDESLFEIPVFATALPESDGVESDVENAAPNNGDGNNDNTPDSQQSYIASLPDINGTYLTYVSNTNKSFSDVRIIDQSKFNKNQNNVILSAGVHEFTIDDILQEEAIEIGVLLPVNVAPSAYYIYGSTKENSDPHWYNFDFDGKTGASFIGVAKFTSPTGNVINRSVVWLRLKNGGRGDSSSEQNNKLVVKGAIKYNYSDSDSGGGVFSIFFLQAMLLSLLFRKCCR